MEFSCKNGSLPLLPSRARSSCPATSPSPPPLRHDRGHRRGRDAHPRITPPARIAIPRWGACARWASRWKARAPSSRFTAGGSTGCAPPAGGSGRRQLRLHHPHALRHSGRRSRSRTRIFGDESLSRRPMQRIMTAAGGNGRAHPRARGQVSAARNPGRARCGPSITRCRWPARR